MYEPSAKEIGVRIMMLRAERGWKQRELAERSGVSIRSIATYETYRCWPGLFNAARLAGAFGVTLDYLVFGGGVDDD